MKKILFAVVLAMIWSAPVPAQDPIKDKAKPDVKKADETVAAGDTHESLADEALKAWTGFADVLATIKDKDSADKAKPDLKKAGEKLVDLKARFEKIGEPKGDKKDELDKKYKPKMDEIQKKVQGELLRISKGEGGQDIIKDIATALVAEKPKEKK